MLPIVKEALSEKVASHLRAKILLGEYKPGHHLSETQLSRELSISRGPIREAIQMLEHEGLTVTPGNGRTLVKGFAAKDVRDLFAVRLLLEAQAIRTLTKSGDPGQLSPLEEIQRELAQSGDRIEAIRLDIEFHQRLAELSQNRTLINLWSMLKGLISTLIEMTTGNYEELAFVARSHADILQALRGGDAEAAVAHLERHMQVGERMICDYLESRLHS